MHEDHKAPIVAVNIWYHVGSKDEKPGRTGFAHLFEHLMFNGSENRKDEFFRPLEAAGATKLNGTTWSNRGPMVSCAPWTTSHAGAARGAGKCRATRSLRRAEQRR